MNNSETVRAFIAEHPESVLTLRPVYEGFRRKVHMLLMKTMLFAKVQEAANHKEHAEFVARIGQVLMQAMQFNQVQLLLHLEILEQLTMGLEFYLKEPTSVLAQNLLNLAAGLQDDLPDNEPKEPSIDLDDDTEELRRLVRANPDTITTTENMEELRKTRDIIRGFAHGLKQGVTLATLRGTAQIKDSFLAASQAVERILTFNDYDFVMHLTLLKNIKAVTKNIFMEPNEASHRMELNLLIAKIGNID